MPHILRRHGKVFCGATLSVSPYAGFNLERQALSEDVLRHLAVHVRPAATTAGRRHQGYEAIVSRLAARGSSGQSRGSAIAAEFPPSAACRRRPPRCSHAVKARDGRPTVVCPIAGSVMADVDGRLP